MHRNPRIIGGERIEISSIPWQLSLRLNGIHICGASLITENRALTAATCVKRNIKKVEYTILAGSAMMSGDMNSIEVGVSEFIFHSKFNSTSNCCRYNIVVMKLSKSIPFGSKTKPILLPKQSSEVAYRTMANVSGWGKTESNSMSEHVLLANVTTATNQQCNTFYSGIIKITDDMVCAGDFTGKKGICVGDQGGALVSNNLQIGIASFSLNCALWTFPGVYTRVAFFSDWIKSVL